MATRTPLALLDHETTTQLRPRYEGSNIGSWIGFKHINYLAEEAVLDHLRVAGFSARSLYEDYGLCLETVDLDTRISTGFRIDDLVDVVVRPEPQASDGELAFVVSVTIRHGTQRRKAAKSKIRVLLRRDFLETPAASAPATLLPFVVERIARTGFDPAPIRRLDELTRKSHSFVWRRRIPYRYCHFTCRAQMSGNLRLMEESSIIFSPTAACQSRACCASGAGSRWSRTRGHLQKRHLPGSDGCLCTAQRRTAAHRERAHHARIRGDRGRKDFHLTERDEQGARRIGRLNSCDPRIPEPRSSLSKARARRRAEP